MTAIEMPASPGFTTCRFGLETNTQTFTSPLTKSTQRVILGGARWNAAYSLPAMNRARAAAWKAFFLLLEGGANTFNAFDPDNKTPRGNAITSDPLVNGGSQTGSSLITDGWVHGAVVLKAGDYFSVGGELKMVTADVLSDGSGNATIPFKPALRNSPADNAPLTVDRPTCAMALADDTQAMWECNVNGVYQPKTFSAFEVFTVTTGTRDITSDTLTAATADTIHPVILVKLEFDGGNVNVHSELGDLLFGSDTYTGIGTLGNVGVADEVSDLSNTPISLTLSNIPGDMGAVVLGEYYQGRRATIYLGYLSLTTRALIADPTIIYRGRIDTSDIQQDQSFTVTLSVQSRFAAWDRPLVRRYNNSDQRQRYLTDTGLQFIEQTADKVIIWGGAA